MDHHGTPTLPVWLRLIAGLSVALCAAFLVSVVPGVRDGGVTFWDSYVYDAVSVTATAVCVGRALVQPQERLAWLALGAALAFTASGDLIWSILAAHGEPGTPSLADVGYLGFYPLTYAGVILLTRARMTSPWRGSWLDGVVSGLATTAVVAGLSWQTIATGAVGSTAGVVTALAYPVGDLLLIMLVLGCFAASGWRPGRGLLLIGAGLLLWGLADTIYLYETARGTYAEGGPLDALWPLGMIMVALAASQRATFRARRTDWTVLAMPPLAASLGAGVLVVSSLGHGRDVAVLIAGGAVLAAVARTVLGLRESLALASTRRLALTDELTGLPNRRALNASLEAAIGAGRPVGLVLFDLDRFKAINDTHGHATGDEVLRRLAPRLAEQLRPSDLLARLGGDEFAVAVEGATDERALAAVIARLEEALERPFALPGLTARVGASFGVALAPDDATDLPALLEHADVAMYRAKHERRLAAAPDRRGLSAEVERAITEGEFELHVQPLVDPASGQAVAAEALLRWRHPRRGLLLPASFLADVPRPSALTDHVIALALELRDQWDGLDLPLSINLAADDVLDPALPERVAHATGLRLEFTEEAVLVDPERALSVLCRLCALGHELVLDDFGVGASSLAMLKRLPVAQLKLHGAIAAGLGGDERDVAIVESALALGRALGLEVVVEGVESAAGYETLQQLGGGLVQGFAVARPMPGAALPAWVAQRAELPVA